MGKNEDKRMEALVALVTDELGTVSLPRAKGSPSDRRFHEAGHAVVDHARGYIVTCVDIDGDGGASRMSATGPDVERLVEEGYTPETVRPLLVGWLAGIVAEAMAHDEPSWQQAQNDLSATDEYAARACPASESEANELIRRYAREAAQVLQERWKIVEALAGALGKERKLEGPPLLAILETS